MKTKLTNTLGSEYFKNRIKTTEERVNALDESYSTRNARLLGFYQAIATGLMQDLEKHEKNQINYEKRTNVRTIH